MRYALSGGAGAGPSPKALASACQGLAARHGSAPDPGADVARGIAPADVTGFIVAQLFRGAGAATALFAWLTPALPEVADRILAPHVERTGRGRKVAE